MLGIGAFSVRSLGRRPSVANMRVIGGAYAIYALSLIFQSARWSRTPAYHNLLIIAPAQAWGAAFAVSSALLFAGAHWRSWRPLPRVTLGAAMVITAVWTTAFVVRWATSGATTPETWVSWAINMYLLLRAWVLLNVREVAIPERPSPGGGG